MYLKRCCRLLGKVALFNHARGNNIDTGAGVYPRFDNGLLDPSGDSDNRNRRVGIRFSIRLNRRGYISIKSTDFLLLNIHCTRASATSRSANPRAIQGDMSSVSPTAAITTFMLFQKVPLRIRERI